MPVVANGDIDGPVRAREVLRYTGADAVMIGRAGQGRPWIFREVAHFLATGELLRPPPVDEVRQLLLSHLDDHYRFYGAEVGVRTARKHIIWYTRALEGGDDFCDRDESARRLPRAATCGRRLLASPCGPPRAAGLRAGAALRKQVAEDLRKVGRRSSAPAASAAARHSSNACCAASSSISRTSTAPARTRCSRWSSNAVERPLLQFAMTRAGGNQSAAAELLGINRNTLRKKLQQQKLT